jgi:hypothetical protein
MLVDFAVILRAREGDDVAFNQIMAAYRKRILGTIARLIGRPEDVEDVGQEVFVRLYYSLDQLRTGGIRAVAVPADGERGLRLFAEAAAHARVADGGLIGAAGVMADAAASGVRSKEEGRIERRSGRR